jgi:hypothetical protein
VIVVGDWNVIQNYDKDTINYQSENNRRSRAQVKVHQMMNNLDLIDIWRVASEIGINYRSDHSPVCMKLKFINQTRGRGTWKFNNSLLTDNEFVNKVKQNINEVITEYEYDPDMDLENPENTFRIDSHLLWETIKVKIRGTAISCSSYKKSNILFLI